MGFLSSVVAGVRRELERNPLDDSALMARAVSMPPARDFRAALEGERPVVIAEIERASPWAGPAADVDPRALARAYESGGAAAVSVVTELRNFDGTLSDLQAARVSTRLPVMRHDFLVHPAQLVEARIHGADAALLLAAALSDAELAALARAAGDVGMAAVVEAHAAKDLDRAMAAGAEIVCINAREMETLDVDEEAALELVRRARSEVPVVLAGPIARRDQVQRAEEAGAAAVLAGESLVRARSASTKLRQLRGMLAVVE